MKKPLIFGILVTLVLFCSCDPNKKVRENPLIAEWTGEFGLPPFKKITVADYGPALDYSMKLHLAEMEVILENEDEPVFENVILPLDSAGRRLELVTGLLTLAGSVDSGKELDSLKIEVARKMAAHSDAIFHNAELFTKVESVYDERLALDSLQVRLTERIYAAFVRNGAALSDSDKAELKKINGELAVRQAIYSNNLLASRNETVVVADSSRIEGIPLPVCNIASKLATANGMHGRFVFTQYDPVVEDVLMFSKNSGLRAEVFGASEKIGRSDSLHDNRMEVEDIVRLRNEKASLLGYGSYAAYVTADAMAGSVGAVYGMLDGIWEPALKKSAEELRIIREGRTDFLPMSASDWSFYLAQSRVRQTTVDQEQFEKYMTVDNVRLGAFELCNRLFGLTFRPIAVELYDNDCDAFEVFDTDNSHLGFMIFDYYTKPGKRSGAWTHCVRPRRPYGGAYADPVVCMAFNFTKPASASRPASLSFAEIEQMFRQIGNALEIMLPDTPYAVLQRTEPDFTGMTGELLTYWAFEPQMVMNYAIHYSAGNQTTEVNALRLYSGRNYRRGYDILRTAASVYMAIDVHMPGVSADMDVDVFARERLLAERGLPDNIAPLFTATNFGSVFGLQEHGGFYGRLWAASLGADVYDMFKKSGNVFDRRVALRLRNEILSKGGSAPAEALYRNFRGRDVSLARFLVYNGMADESLIAEKDTDPNPMPQELQSQDTIPAPVPALELWKPKPAGQQAVSAEEPKDSIQ